MVFVRWCESGGGAGADVRIHTSYILLCTIQGPPRMKRRPPHSWAFILALGHEERLPSSQCIIILRRSMYIPEMAKTTVDRQPTYTRLAMGWSHNMPLFRGGGEGGGGEYARLRLSLPCMIFFPGLTSKNSKRKAIVYPH